MRVPEAVRCPDCGTEIVVRARDPGAVPAVPAEPRPQGVPRRIAGRPDRVGDRRRRAPDRGHPRPPDAGRILGERYQIRELLGRGGMGEVFRAFDLKLRVDVALKAVRPEKLRVRARPGGAPPRGPLGPRGRLPQRLPHLRPRRRGRPGARLDGVHRRRHPARHLEAARPPAPVGGPGDRGPVPLRARGHPPGRARAPGLQARERHAHPRGARRRHGLRARQGGLGADGNDLGHAGLHGPRAGARRAARRAGRRLRGGAGPRGDAVASGTASGRRTRRDVTGCRVGAVARGPRDAAPRARRAPGRPCCARRSRLFPRSAPPRRGRSPARSRTSPSACPASRTERPYPGLSSFTEEDAAYFFGRELEVEALWKKLRRPRLLALVGPSGAGKSSFLRAGLLPALPRGWKALVATTRPSALPGARAEPGPRLRGGHRRDGGAPPVRGARHRGLAAEALPPAPRARPPDRRPVRGAVHPVPARDPAGLRRAPRPPRPRRGRARAPVAARRLPRPLPRARAPRSRHLRPHHPRPPRGERAAARARAARAQVRLPLRGRGARRRDGRRGRERARRAAAPRLRRLAPVGDARPRTRPRHPRGLRRDRRRRGRPRPARGGDPRAHRRHRAPRSSARSSATSSRPRAPAPSASATSCCRVFAASRRARGLGREAVARGRAVLDALVDARLLTSYERAGEGEREPPPGRDRPRVAARGVAAPRPLADAGPGRRAAARPAAPGRPALARSRRARRSPLVRPGLPRLRAVARAQPRRAHRR